ncbi:MAG TPA: trehalose-6-phosphate synthase [Acidimicrobiales bacterium]|nr:trehalose-6-phosphate synthase [Acidimicrobiales bacterium]
MSRPVVVVSNRGPLSFRRDEAGALVARRGAGGLVSGLGPLVAGTDSLWVAAAMSDGDRAAAEAGVVDAEDFRVRLLATDPETYRLAYDVISNQVLWFVYHGLYDLPREPAFGPGLAEAWQAYRTVNAAFADAVADTAPDGAAVLVQDYHLGLLGLGLAERRPDLAAVHFSHTPFATPAWLRVLPPHMAAEVVSGLAAHRACGFHTRGWAADFLACSREVLALTPATFVSPLPTDADDVRRAAASPACDAALAEIDAAVGDRRVIARVDRIELSKNLLRGFLAFDELLARSPRRRGAVVFVASVYPSRTGVPAYLDYQAEVEAVVRRINDRWGTPDWTPILYDTRDDYPHSVAVLRRADVLLVNPIRDGLNLVAKEGAIVNERNAVLCLSREAGVWDEVGEAALQVHPYDLVGTAEALEAALAMPAAERAPRAARLRELSVARRPADWLADQLAAAG